MGEAEQILKLQYLCFQSQAALYDDWSLPPLTQTLPELLQEYDSKEILAARLGWEVIGSVRANMEGETCFIDRLVVHPRLQGSGLGWRLMREIEYRFNGTAPGTSGCSPGTGANPASGSTADSVTETTARRRSHLR